MTTQHPDLQDAFRFAMSAKAPISLPEQRRRFMAMEIRMSEAWAEEAARYATRYNRIMNSDMGPRSPGQYISKPCMDRTPAQKPVERIAPKRDKEIIALLRKRPMCYRELEAAMDLKKSTIKALVQELTRNGKVAVSHAGKTGNYYTVVR